MHVFVSGPASWNSIVYVDKLPDPRPHTVFAQDSYETFGGTSLGKALNLAGLGVSTTLATLLSRDSGSSHIESLLREARIDLINTQTEATERHLNLMTYAGERLSIYLSAPGESLGPNDALIAAEMQQADAVIMDLSAESSRLLPMARESGRPIWTDIHDFDGTSSFHEPFIDASHFVFMNADGIGDPRPFMSGLLARGKELVVCTLGAQGAVALDAQGFVESPAIPTDVVDTNGAGDAFMAGFMVRHIAGAPLADSLRAGAEQASAALGARGLHPLVDQYLAGLPN